jgi:hypothetical protein
LGRDSLVRDAWRKRRYFPELISYFHKIEKKRTFTN